MEALGSSRRTRASADEAKFGILFFKRFWNLCKYLCPSWCNASVWLTLFLLLLCLLDQVVTYFVGLVTSKFYKIFTEQNRSEFTSHVAYSISLIIAKAFLLSLKSYVASLLCISWRRSICYAIHNQYFSDILYYRLNVTDKTIDNPDQRITQDVDRLCRTFSLVLVPVIITPFTICYYIYKCWTVTSYLGPVSTISFFIIFTAINKLLMSPVARYVYLQEKMEGNFRFQHMQIRVNAESAAFYQAESTEKSKANQKLDTLLSTQRRLIGWQFALNCCINLADYFGGILSYIAISFPIFSGEYASLSPGDLTSLISQYGFYSIYLVNCFTTLIDQSAQMTDVVGTTHRIGQLFEELHRLKEEHDELEQCDGSSTETECLINSSGDQRSIEVKDAALDVKNVTYGQPKSFHILCKNLTFQLSSGINILVTGDSGCGKTSLLRILCGLWKPVSGVINKNVVLGPGGMFYLPQKPYLTDGTLRDQVVYPLQDCQLTDNRKIEDCLRSVGLTGLLNRLGGLDATTDWNWYDQLSPGEMQRLSFVRLFFHHPPYAILDEATSQVSEDMEQLLYKTCFEMKITVLSVGHRSTIRPFHDMELRLTVNGDWSLNPIVSSS